MQGQSPGVPSGQRAQPSLAVSQGELHYLLLLLSLPRCFLPAPTPTSFLLWIKSYLPLLWGQEIYIYISPYITGTFSEF